MPTTARGYPYPNGGDAADGPANLQALAAAVDADVTGIGTWSTWTPTWTAASGGTAIGNSTVVARRATSSKVVRFYLTITFGSTATYGTGLYSFTGLVAPAQATAVHAQLFDTSTGFYYPGSADMTVAGTIARLVFGAGGNTGMSPTVPITLATGDILKINGTYEIP